MSDTMPWLLDNADVVLEASSIRVLDKRPGNVCVTLEVTVQSVLKGDVTLNGVLVGVHLDSAATESCTIGLDCLPLQRSLVYLSNQPSPICGHLGRAILDITPPTSGMQTPVVEAASYLSSQDKSNWAEKIITAAPADEAAARSAVAATLNDDPANASVRRVLRSVALNDSLDEFVRQDTLKVLETTRSPERMTIIRDLQTTKASADLKRYSLSRLDNSPAANALLAEMTQRPDVGGRAAALLTERGILSPASQHRQQLQVDDPKKTALAQFLNVINAQFSPQKKEDTLREIVGRLTPADEKRFHVILAQVAVAPANQEVLDKILRTVKEPR